MPGPPAAARTPVASPTPRTPVWPDFTVAALGDSVTAGTHCGCEPFPELYGTELRARYGSHAAVANDGAGGQTSADVLDELRHDKGDRADVGSADVLLLTIGANDFTDHYDEITAGRCASGSDQLACVRTELSTLAGNLDAILAAIEQLRGGRPTAVLVTGYWAVFEDGDVASAGMTRSGLATSDQLTRVANAEIATAAGHAGATYVDLYRPFKGELAERNPTRLLADDGDHPNAAGHRLIARTLLAAGLAPLAPR